MHWLHYNVTPVSTPINQVKSAHVLQLNSDFHFDGHSHLGPPTHTKHTLLRKKIRQTEHSLQHGPGVENSPQCLDQQRLEPAGARRWTEAAQ